MSSTQPVTINWNGSLPNFTEPVVFRNQNETRPEVIEIDDIQDLPLDATSSTKTDQRLAYTVGILPTPAIVDNATLKLSLSVIFSMAFSIWISNGLMLGIFALLNIFNFLTSLIWDREIGYTVKASRFFADFFIMAVVATVTEIVFGKISVPFTNLNISVFSIALYYYTITYLTITSKRLLPLTTIANSSTPLNLMLGLRYGWEKFKELQEKDTFGNRKH